jgi:diacylglycerol kinase (ATP)
MNRYLIIVNPTSGRGNGRRIIPQLQHNLTELNLSFELVETERPCHATMLAQQAVADGFDVVVAVGGDGTANEVINGLMQSRQNGQGNRTAMGVLPAGRGNDFAYALGMPAKIAESCHILAAGRGKRIDIGWVQGGLAPEGRFFGNSAGIGFDAIVGIEAVKMSPLSGFPSYLAAVFKTMLLNYQAPHVEIAYDGQVVRLPAIMISIMNGQRQGGAFFMAPQAQNDDGLFDLCIAEHVSRARILTLLPHFFKGTQFGQKEIHFGQTGRLEITAAEGVLVGHCDGETISIEGTKLILELRPRQLDVICANGPKLSHETDLPSG